MLLRSVLLGSGEGDLPACTDQPGEIGLGPSIDMPGECGLDRRFMPGIPMEKRRRSGPHSDSTMLGVLFVPGLVVIDIRFLSTSAANTWLTFGPAGASAESRLLPWGIVSSSEFGPLL